MNLVGRLGVASVLSLYILVFGGCNPPSPPAQIKAEPAATGHDEHHLDHHHDHAEADDGEGETFAGEFDELEEHRADLKEALAAGDMKNADAAVHQIGHELEELEEIASGDGVSAEHREVIKAAIKDLFDCFESIDRKIEANQPVNYDDFAERIDAGMQTLKAEAVPEIQ